jgi:hypothetical protein
MMEANLKIQEEERRTRQPQNSIAQAGQFVGGLLGGLFSRLRS